MVRQISLTGFTPLETMEKQSKFQISLTGFTLLELITVVIIITILVSIAIPTYTKAMERAKDKEAIVNLKLIQAAEKIYRLERGFFHAPEDIISNINSYLRLELNNLVWTYAIEGATSSFTARAVRNSPTGYPRNFYLTYDSLNDPTCSGAGCP